MNFDKKRKTGVSSRSEYSGLNKVHPVEMILYLCLMGVGVLFTILLIGYFQSKVYDVEAWRLALPKSFALSMLFLLFSSFYLSKCRGAYRKDNLKKLARYLLNTVLLGGAFFLAQIAGWYEINTGHTRLTWMSSASYVVLITALHTLNFLGGFVFLIVLFTRTQHAAADAIRTLVFIRNPFVRQQLKLINLFWHFVTTLWIIIYLVFLFTLK